MYVVPFRTPFWRFVQFAVRDVQPPTSRRFVRGKTFCQFFDQVDGAVTPPGAPNGDRGVLLALLNEPRQDHLDQFRHALEKAAEEARQLGSILAQPLASEADQG